MEDRRFATPVTLALLAGLAPALLACAAGVDERFPRGTELRPTEIG